MDAPEGWYPDPTGVAQQRYWDGYQWTGALAAPTLLAVPVPIATSPAPPRDWAQRHPAWTTLIVIWVACMLWSWPWLAPTLAASAALVAAARWERARRARLTADADEQNELLLDGDPRGIYGHFPPADPADVN